MTRLYPSLLLFQNELFLFFTGGSAFVSAEHPVCCKRTSIARTYHTTKIRPKYGEYTQGDWIDLQEWA